MTNSEKIETAKVIIRDVYRSARTINPKQSMLRECIENKLFDAFMLLDGVSTDIDEQLASKIDP